MYRYGFRTIIIVLLIEIIIMMALKGMFPIWGYVIVLFVDLILFGIVTVDSKSIKIYSTLMLLKGKNTFLLSDISEICLGGVNGMTPGRVDITIHEKNANKTFIFLLIYPFERKLLEKRLIAKDLKVTTI